MTMQSMTAHYFSESALTTVLVSGYAPPFIKLLAIDNESNERLVELIQIGPALTLEISVSET